MGDISTEESTVRSTYTQSLQTDASISRRGDAPFPARPGGQWTASGGIPRMIAVLEVGHRRGPRTSARPRHRSCQSAYRRRFLLDGGTGRGLSVREGGIRWDSDAMPSRSHPSGHHTESDTAGAIRSEATALVSAGSNGPTNPAGCGEGGEKDETVAQETPHDQCYRSGSRYRPRRHAAAQPAVHERRIRSTRQLGLQAGGHSREAPGKVGPRHSQV